MAFMIPVYENGPFATVTSAKGDWLWTGPDGYQDPQTGEAVEIETGWHWHLSAPGYLDQTDWRGPFSSKDDAMRDCNEWHDTICCHCGEERDYENYKLTCECGELEDTDND